jgi:DNA-binding XRE family transcriptional regulator
MKKPNSHKLVTLHNQVGAVRRRVGFPQLALAERLEIHRSNLYRIESGQVVPSVLLALLIAKYLSTPLQELFSLEEIKVLTEREKFLLKMKEIEEKIASGEAV